MGMPKYDLGSIWKMMFREETRSLAVSLAADTDFQIELDAEDGDSVEAVPKFICIQDPEVAQDAKRFKEAALYIKPLKEPSADAWVDIYVNPSGEEFNWYKLVRIPVPNQEMIVTDVYNICAASIKVVNGLTKSDLELKLVMKS